MMTPISIILPIHNGSALLQSCIDSISYQSKLPDELIIVDDASTDDSFEKAKLLTKKMKCKVRYIRHTSNKGLAQSYNSGIAQASGDMIITIHQDAKILDESGLKKLLKPFENPDVVAAGHIELIDYSVWLTYPFWLKAFTSRQMGKRPQGINGKFDAFRKSALLAVGNFDYKTYRTAGEDGDIVYKLSKMGTIAQTDATVIHLHKHDFTFKDFINKHAQLAEAQGVNLRRGRVHSLNEVVRVLFREILLIMAIIPVTRLIGIGLIIAFSILYSKNLYQKERTNVLILVLPFANIYTLIIDSIFLIRGFFQKKQNL